MTSTNAKGSGPSKEYKFEKVTFVPSAAKNGEFIPRIVIHQPTKNEQSRAAEEEEAGPEAAEEKSPEASPEAIAPSQVRPFRADDMPRVLDFDNMPEPPPADAALGHLEFELNDDDTISEEAPPRFPKRHCCLRGSYVFYFDTQEVAAEGPGDAGGFASPSLRFCPFKAPPLGVIPLERTVVEFPPGGRRVFREHAQTAARHGYEMVIRHLAGKASTATKRRAPAYLVMDGIGQRDFWAKAIRIRADVYMKDTKLRPSGDMAPAAPHAGPDPYRAARGLSPERAVGRLRGLRRAPLADAGPAPPLAAPGSISVLAGVMEEAEQKDVEDALLQFGNKTVFEELAWVDTFYQAHDEYEAPAMCATLERWQCSIKKGLRGAVLEQYEYFVEASREMTTMGREVMSLKQLVADQVDTIDAMKNVDFELDFDARPLPASGLSTHYADDEPSEDTSDDDDDSKSRTNARLFLPNTHDALDSPGSFQRRTSKSSHDAIAYKLSKGATANTTSSTTNANDDSGKDRTQDAASFQLEVPAWLEDAAEEISAFIKECRHADAAELLFKAKTDATEILSMHDKLSEKKLAKKQLATLQRILRSIDSCTDRLCNRLSEGLRRKNEALKQAAKKERADPLSALAPLVSPIALNDDATSLQLLVKLGRAQDAATAYSARRSLLLTECLHERPICDTTTTNNMDVVIYAAQLSQSFFSCLATSVEGFLDLFLGGNAKDDISESSSTILSAPFQQQKVVPASALAAIVLWCDSELNKFSATFGSKVLGNLSLSPRDLKKSNSITDKITEFEAAADISHLKNQLRSAEEMGEFLAAGKLRKKIAILEKESKEGNMAQKSTNQSAEGRNRKLAISIAGKCVDQALEFSTECLNTIGLPLTPRLAEYMRPRLKGAEAEVAMELEDRWDHIIFDWKDAPVENEDVLRLSTEMRTIPSHDSE